METLEFGGPFPKDINKLIKGFKQAKSRVNEVTDAYHEVLWILKDEPQTCVSVSAHQLEGEGDEAGLSLASTVSPWDAEISGT